MWKISELKSSRIRALLKKDRLLIALLSGILLLVVTWPAGEEQEETGLTGYGADAAAGTAGSAGGSGASAAYAADLERRLEEVLSQTEGVGRTEVMVTLQSTAEKVVEKDRESESESVEETDSQGGTRTTVKSRSGSSTVYGEGESTARDGGPYVTKELSPAVEGVVVLAQGGSRPETVRDITEAVQALFHVDTHKIKVMKLKES